MKLISALIGCSLLLGMGACTQTSTSQDYTNFVNPFIGTGGHGHTYPGVVVPNGMIQQPRYAYLSVGRLFRLLLR